MNNYRVGQFTVTRLWPKWVILERGSDGITRQIPVGSFWSWTWAARTAEIMRRIYCDGQDWDGNGQLQPETDDLLIQAWRDGGGVISDDGRAATWLADLPKVLKGVIASFKHS